MKSNPAIQRFGGWTLCFLVIANMIGAGVFTTSGFTLSDLGSPRGVVLAWVAGGIVAMAGAFSYGQLIRVMPESGGEYLFLSRAIHPLLGFIAGWVSLIAGFSGAIAFAATTFETYCLPGNLRPAWLPVDGVAVLLIVFGGILHGIKPSVGAVLQNTVVVFKLILLTGLLGWAAITASSHSWHHEPLLDYTITGWPWLWAFVGTLVWISLSYSGFNAAVYVADEAKDARNSIPKAMLAATLIVMIVYVLLNWVFVHAAPANEIVGQPEVAAIAARALGGERLAGFVRLTICVALLTSVISMMMAAPRVYAKMAEDGLMPVWLRHQEHGPVIATVVQVVLASVLVMWSTLAGLLQYLGLTLSLSAACSVACLFLPKIRREHHIGVGATLISLFYVLATITAATALTYGNPKQLIAAAATFAVGGVVYFIAKLRKR